MPSPLCIAAATIWICARLALKPDLKAIMMTGYAINQSKLAQDRNIDTLRKPFDLNMLGSRARKLATGPRTTMLD